MKDFTVDNSIFLNPKGPREKEMAEYYDSDQSFDDETIPYE